MDLGKLQRFLPSAVRHRRRQQKQAASGMERALRLNNFRPEPMDHQRQALRRWLSDDEGGDAQAGGLLILDLSPEFLLPAARLVLTMGPRDTRPERQGNRLVTVHVAGYPSGQAEPGSLLAGSMGLMAELAGHDVAAEHARVDSDGRVVLMLKEASLRA